MAGFLGINDDEEAFSVLVGGIAEAGVDGDSAKPSEDNW